MGGVYNMKFLVIILALAYSASAIEKNDINRLTKSVVFVVDTNRDFSLIRSAISSDFGKSGKHPNYEYSLIEFNRTDFAPVLTRGSLDKFDGSLNNLTLVPQSTCPRKSRGGIREGLNVSSSESFMIIITSGAPNISDVSIQEIFSTLAEKRIRVYFVSEGRCDKNDTEFDDIAAVSNGQFIPVSNRNKTGELLNLLVNSTRVDLLAVDTDKTESLKEILVDETMTEILISIYSKGSRSLRVIDSNNSTSSCNTSIFSISSSFQVCRIQSPVTGRWNIGVEDSQKLYSLRVSAVSSLRISFGFDTELNSRDRNMTFCQPIPGRKNYFFINLEKLPPNALVSSAEIIWTNGKIKPLVVEKVDKTLNLYYSEFEFNSTDSTLFRIQIEGRINTKETFRRITPVAFGNYSVNFQNGLKSCSLPYIVNEEITTTAASTTSTMEITPTTQSTTTTTTTTKSITSASSPPSSTESNPKTKPEPEKLKNSGLSTPVIILIVIFTILLLAALIAGVVIYLKSDGTYNVHQVFVRNKSMTREDESDSSS